jgi:hypothetical protein
MPLSHPETLAVASLGVTVADAKVALHCRAGGATYAVPAATTVPAAAPPPQHDLAAAFSAFACLRAAIARACFVAATLAGPKAKSGASARPARSRTISYTASGRPRERDLQVSHMQGQLNSLISIRTFGKLLLYGCKSQVEGLQLCHMCCNTFNAWAPQHKALLLISNAGCSKKNSLVSHCLEVMVLLR